MSNTAEMSRRHAEARYFLMADSRDKFIIQRDKQNFCGVVFSEARLVRIEK